MIDVVSVKFKGRGKTYYFDPNGVDAHEGDKVVVETSKGLELAECVQAAHCVNDERIVPPLRPVIRVATGDDLRIAELCKAREKEAFGICEQKIAEHGLDMKLVDVECNFEGNKILFFFTSDGRVDFRELVKDLASVFRARIELRQIGVRDEAKMLGGLGICGRPFCCHAFLDDFEPVSTKMAKTQSLSLNPTKISGSCGRLMCCLRYEQEAYEELVKTVPKNGAFVQTTCGYGNVCQVNLLRQKVKVKLDGDDEAPRTFEAYEVATVPGGRPKPGEPLPQVLEIKPRKMEEDEKQAQELLWKRPPVFAEDTAEEKNAESEQKNDEKKRRGSKNRNRKSAETQGTEKHGSEERKPEPAAEKTAAAAESESTGKKPYRGCNHRRGGKPNATQTEGTAKQDKQTTSKQEPKKTANNAEGRTQDGKKSHNQTETPRAEKNRQDNGGAPKRNYYRRYRGKGKPKSGGKTE